MSAFNEIAGVPSSANPRLLTGILRDQWGFDGVVVSDWDIGRSSCSRTASPPIAPHAGRLALTAGVDIDMQAAIYSGELVAEARAGRLPMAVIDRSVRRVLRAKQRAGLFEDPYRHSDAEREKRAILTPAHREAARQVARDSIVLLGNRARVLPLSPDVRTIAVIGALADSAEEVLGPWSSAGDPKDAVSVLDGIRRAVSDKTRVVYARGVSLTAAVPGSDDAREQERAIAAAAQQAGRADAVVLVVGEPEA